MILHLLVAAGYQRGGRIAATYPLAYSDVVNDGERADRPGERGLLELEAAMPECDFGALELRPRPRSPRAGRHRSESKAPLVTAPLLVVLVVAGVAFLLGILLSWWVRPAPSEQLSAARAEIAQQSGQIRRLQGELSRVTPVAQDMAVRELRLADSHAALDAREAQIAQREQALDSHWSVPKPSAQQVEGLLQRVAAWLKDASDTISRLLKGETALESAPADAEQAPQAAKGSGEAPDGERIPA